MPGLSGWEVARRLREQDGKHTRIVMLSANANDVLPDEDEARLYDAYLMKPLVIQQLLDTIKSMLQIEWTYEKETPLIAAVRPPVPLPSSEHISDLLRLGQIGYVRGIQAKLIEIERESAEHKLFVAELQEIIGRFDLKRYMSVLEAMQVDDAR
jgi:CheY-like chemotaxis protein